MLNPQGLLSNGVHDLTLEEVKAHFGSFNGSDRRCRLFDQLREYIGKISASDWLRGILLDGSFVTDKQAPSDIDLIVIIDAEALPDDEPLKPAEYNLLSRRMGRKLFGFDILVAPLGSEALDHWIEYFSRVKGSEQQRKGLVRLVL